MPRRSWRDLDRSPSPASAGLPVDNRPSGPSELEQAAALLPGSRLEHLLEERRALEQRLRQLTGLAQQHGSGDAHRDARFSVPSFAERQAELRQWESQRQSQRDRRAQQAWGNQARWQNQRAQSPHLGLPEPATNLGATGLSSGMGELTRGLSAGTDRLRQTANPALDRPRAAAARLDEWGRPLRQMGDQLADQSRQMDDLDRRLAAEGVSEAERAEVRSAVRADEIDRVSSVLDRANQALEAPKRAVAKIDRFWQEREQQISGPMDRFSGYAAERDRRLSTEFGGSGDLFERMQSNRMRALERRQEYRMQERRDERRRARAGERRAERS